MRETDRSWARKIDPEILSGKFGRYVNPGQSRLFRYIGFTAIEWWGEGAVVIDSEGREFLDLCAGYAVMNLGHRHPKVVEAVKAQLDRLPLSTRTMLNQPQALLAEQLAEITPGELQYSFFCASGAEAVEAALKLARAHTGRSGLVACRGGFHGKTLGALSATGPGVYRDVFQPLVPGAVHVPFNDIAALEEAVGEDTAAVIVEPIQGEAGVRLPDAGYLRSVRDICRRKGALFIADEVQTGLGRTGANFACEHYDVVPDLMTLAKGLGGGVMPLGAAVGRPEVFAVFDEHPFLHTSTTGGNPLACAAGLATLEVLQEEDLAGQAAEKGQFLLDRLRDLQQDYPRVLSEVRGKGLLIGLSFARPGAGAMMITELYSRRVLIIPSLMDFTVMRVAPPLVISREQMERALDAFDQALAEVDRVIDEL